MTDDVQRAGRPIVLWSLLVYAGASFWHFAHNATYLDAYPNLPAYLSAARVWLAWCAVTSVGVAGYVLLRRGRMLPGLGLIGVYAACGFDGLAHYAAAPMAAHTLTMNLTIWLEAFAAALLLAEITRALRLVRRERRPFATHA